MTAIPTSKRSIHRPIRCGAKCKTPGGSYSAPRLRGTSATGTWRPVASTSSPFPERRRSVWRDGTVHRLGPGDVNLAEDLTGHGHTTRVVGDVPRVTATIHLDD